jgi:hypothetical protein
LNLVLEVLQVVETWVQTLQREEVELARGTLEIARQDEAMPLDFLTDALAASEGCCRVAFKSTISFFPLSQIHGKAYG